MGKGFENYMSKKWFHPTNIENQKRKYVAEQKAAADKKRQQELREQYEREQEIFSSKQLMGDEKARLGLAFMYNAPGMLKDQQENKKEEEDKFDWQKIAREQSSKSNDPSNLKQQRCIKCKRLGHVNTDRVCPLYGKSRLDTEASSVPQFDPEELTENFKIQDKTPKLDLNKTSEKDDEETTDDGDDNEVTLDMLRALPKREKKVLLKRLNKLGRKIQKSIG